MFGNMNRIAMNRKTIKYKLLMISVNLTLVLLFMYLYIWNDFENKELEPFFGLIYLIIVFVSNLPKRVFTGIIPILYLIVLIVYYYI